MHLHDVLLCAIVTTTAAQTEPEKIMIASNLFQDIATNCLTEVVSAARVFEDHALGVRVRQSFYIYPDDTIVSLLASDGGYSVLTLEDHDAATFRHLNRSYFQ